MFRTLALAAGLGLASGSAFGQASAVPPVFNVYDANGKLVGPLMGRDKQGHGLVVTQLRFGHGAPPPGAPYFLSVAQKGFPPATFYYPQPGCGGFPFLPFDPENEILPTAVSIEGLIYGHLTSQFNTYTFASKGVAGQKCEELEEPTQLMAAPAFNSQSAFKPPFTVKP